jgi:hypothetical protein
LLKPPPFRASRKSSRCESFAFSEDRPSKNQGSRSEPAFFGLASPIREDWSAFTAPLFLNLPISFMSVPSPYEFLSYTVFRASSRNGLIS